MALFLWKILKTWFAVIIYAVNLNNSNLQHFDFRVVFRMKNKKPDG